MSELAFWRTVVQDRSDFLGGILGLLEENAIRYCAVGGVAVNAYAEPVVTLDLDLVVTIDDLDRATELIEHTYRVTRFEHSVNVRDAGSGLQVQFQLDPRMSNFVDRSEVRDVLGVMIPVASPRELMKAKVAAASDGASHPPQRLQDLTDISRLLEVIPELADDVPTAILERLER